MSCQYGFYNLEDILSKLRKPECRTLPRLCRICCSLASRLYGLVFKSTHFTSAHHFELFLLPPLLAIPLCTLAGSWNFFSYFLVLSQLFFISQLFHTYFPSQLFPISYLFPNFIYFSLLTCNCSKLISQLFLDSSLASQVFL